jgi:hypothetical protein
VFTSFDQLVPNRQPTALMDATDLTEPIQIIQFVLHHAKITIYDDEQPGDKGMIKSKPNIDYLLQVEPASSSQPGWMIARKYNDFETLHEVLRRISVISGIPDFTLKYGTIPSWKNKTKTAFRQDLEGYLKEALSHARLAESEGMKRFFERDEWRVRAEEIIDPS